MDFAAVLKSEMERKRKAIEDKSLLHVIYDNH